MSELVNLNNAPGTVSTISSTDKISLLINTTTNPQEALISYANFSQNLALGFARADIPSLTVPTSINSFQVSGYSTVGDGGQGALYKRGTSSGPMAIQDASGAWFELVVTDFVNIKWFGAVDGSSSAGVVTANTTAINNAIAALPSTTGSFGPGVATHSVYTPAGIFYTNGGHDTSTKRIIFRGEGDYQSTWQRASGAAADMLTLNAQACGVKNMTFGAARSSSTGDGLVMNASYCFAESSSFTGFDNGIVVGKASTCGGFRLRDLRLRDSKNYNIYVMSGSNYDGVWSDIDSGNSGKSSVRIDSGSQNLSNVHVWGGGLEDNTDKQGFYLLSSRNRFSNCQSECNNGWGVFCSTNASETAWTGGSIWGNKSSAWYQFGVRRNSITGAGIFNNNVGNTSQVILATLAAIQFEDSSECNVTGNIVYDSSAAIAAPTYSNYTPAFPYPGRTAMLTQGYAYAEVGTSTNNVIAVNEMPAERCVPGFTTPKSPTLMLGQLNRVTGNNWGNKPIQSVASASTITIPPDSDFVQVTGTTSITTITASYQGRIVTMTFTNASPGTVVKGSNLALDRDYTPVQNATLTVRSELATDQTTFTWREVSRSHTA